MFKLQGASQRLEVRVQKSEVRKICLLFSVICLLFSVICHLAFAQEAKGPIVVNGDVVEYSTDKKEVIATGNISVIYKGTKLTCRKLTVNTQTKDAQAEGDVRIEDQRGIIEGTKALYNFETKIGTIMDANFKANPYFGKAEKIQKLSDKEFISFNGYATTCSFDNPHYRLKSKKISIFPQDKVQMQDSRFCVGGTPVIFIPHYNHSFKDSFMKIHLMPGYKKSWGPYLLAAWRYDLTDNVKGKIYFDYRQKLGPAEGFETNYETAKFGRGDFKYYYAREHDKRQPEGTPSKFQRYLVRWRHKWNIDEQTNLISEYYKITDSKRMLLGTDYNILKDYFPREFEKDSQPLSYVLLHRSFVRSSLDFLIQKRTNRWYEQLEKIPQVQYSLPSIQLGNTPFYLDNNTSFANFNYKHAVPSPSTDDISMNRLDTTNKISLPTKLAFLWLTPFAANRQTYYNKDVNGAAISPRTVFYTGIDASTKFYRLFNVDSSFLGMELKGLRHVITPSVSYTYNHEPTISSLKLKQIDSVDAIDTNNSISFELSNKLQTKRKDETVDLVDFDIRSGYIFYTFDPASHTKSHGQLSDFLLKLKLLPYAWMRLDADATYKTKAGYFSEVNPSLAFYFGNERSIGFGHRYQRKGGKEFSFNTDWRLTPKWKFGFYTRYQFANVPDLTKGLALQQYTLSRDLHCWIMDINFTIEKNKGSTIFLSFKLKAFPEMAFGFNQSYSTPRSGSQSNQ